MGLFGSDDEPNRQPKEESEPDMVSVPVTKEKEYTEHEAVIEWIDGGREEVTFDAMKRKEDTIILKDYEEYIERDVPTAMIGVSRMETRSMFAGKSFMTIPLANLKKLETVNRETKTLEYETTEKVPRSEVDE